MARKGNRWRVEVPSATSLAETPDDAVLVLRLGVAVTALRASQRLTLSVGKGDEPSMVRDRLWAFLLAVAYLHELRVTLQPSFPKVKKLAATAGATDDELKRVGQVMSGNTPLGKVMDRVRNELVFHFDEDAIRTWAKQYSQDVVLWAEGRGPSGGNILYRASTDAVCSALLPNVDVDTAEGRAELAGLIKEVVVVSGLMSGFLESAIASYLNSKGGKLIETLEQDAWWRRLVRFSSWFRRKPTS